MTLLQRTDGDPGASYLELVDLLQSRGAQTQADCEELFRRVVFSICISNTDDHLRNHGFLIGSAGLTLSPVFDINPNPHRRQLSLAIDEGDTTLSLDVAESASEYYGLGIARAREIVGDVQSAVQRWPREARALGIAAREQELMKPAFLIGDGARSR
jgi:serine/threonine-protein kinase HipA